MTRAGLDKTPADVAAMFDAVAPGYDRTNDVLSLGQSRLWRRAVARAVAARSGERVLDLAAGTGTSAEPFAAAGARVVACDFSLGMLDEGAARYAARRSTADATQAVRGATQGAVSFVAGDALSLPFADSSFDAVTISFGLRNVADIDQALAEMLRVARPGGRLVVCEFSSPTWQPFRTMYNEYLMRALPVVARTVCSNPEAYVYLAESIRAWPDQRSLAAKVAAAGWTRVGWRNITSGIVALHTAVAGPRRPFPGVQSGAMPG
ncbi:MAG: demethylmenaquinone methyltransferase [Actinomycetota bacterium]|nr:demethylmenaquinone methyltransferase [Actinomycetota bacterium]